MDNRLMTTVFYSSLFTKRLCSSSHQDMGSIFPPFEPGLALGLVAASGKRLKQLWAGPEPRPPELPCALLLSLGPLCLPLEPAQASPLGNEVPRGVCWVTPAKADSAVQPSADPPPDLRPVSQWAKSSRATLRSEEWCNWHIYSWDIMSGSVLSHQALGRLVCSAHCGSSSRTQYFCVLVLCLEMPLCFLFFQSSNLLNPSIKTEIKNNVNWERFLCLSGQM